MKVVFTMGGITHYLSPLLDNVVRKGVDVVMVIPSVKDNQTIGKGVKLVNNKSGIARSSKDGMAKQF